MDINKYRDTQYLKQEDVMKPLLVTIDHCAEEDVSMESQPEKLRCIIHFTENLKPLIGNWTNLSAIKDINGSGDSDNWDGTKIVLYVDSNVMFAGKRVGGIRVRPPLRPPRQQAQPPQEDGPPPPTDEDVPFEKEYDL